MSEWQETIVGRIPAHWQLKKLSECGFHIGDGNYSSKYPRQSELLEQGIPFISANNLSNGRIKSDGLRFISQEQHDKLQKGHIRTQDVLIVVRGDVGQVALVTDNYEDANINAQLAFLRSPESINSLFVYYLLLHFKKCGITDLHATGSVQPQITIRQLKDFDIILPPRVEQNAITAVLSSLDDKIDLLHRQNKTLESLAQTLFRHWFIDNAQDDWEEGTLGDLIELAYGKGLKKSLRTGEGYPVVGSSGVVDFHSDFLVEAPGIVIGRKGTLGEVIYLSDNFYPIDTTFYVKSKSQSIGLYFEYFLLKSINFKDMNTDSAVPGLNRNLALATEVMVPPQSKIVNFNDLVDPLFQKIIANKTQIRTLEKLRDTLLPKLMSGEVRVRL